MKRTGLDWWIAAVIGAILVMVMVGVKVWSSSRPAGAPRPETTVRATCYSPSGEVILDEMVPAASVIPPRDHWMYWTIGNDRYSGDCFVVSYFRKEK